MHENAVKMIQATEAGARELREELDRIRQDTRAASEQAAREVVASIAAGKQSTEAMRSEILRLGRPSAPTAKTGGSRWTSCSSAIANSSPSPSGRSTN